MRNALKWTGFALLALVVSLFAADQGMRYWQIRSGDRMGAGTKFQMSNVGTTLPATCTVGETYFKSDATAGQNMYGCTATNVWTALGGGGSTVAPEKLIPTGAIAYFNLTACPSGWTEYTTLRGKYAVGLVSSGTLEGGSGTALTNQESRIAGLHTHIFSGDGHGHDLPSLSHSHVVTDPGHIHYISRAGAVSSNSVVTYSTTMDGGFGSTISALTGITVNSASPGSGQTADSTIATGANSNTGSVAGTPAPYVQLRACRAN